MDIDQFRRQIFLADSRNCSEKYGEYIVAGLFNMEKANGKGYDLTRDGRRREVKCVRVVVDRSPENAHLTLLERAIDFPNYEGQKFSGNIQHLKLMDFDDLCYVAFFRDHVLVFEMSVEELRSHARMIGYCPTQAWRSVPDCDGQFALRPSNLHYHLKYFQKGRLTYDEALHNFLLVSSNHTILFTSSEKDYVMSSEDDRIYDYIRANPGQIVRDMAKSLGIAQKHVHQALCMSEGQNLVNSGFVAVEEGTTLESWARNEDGGRRTMIPIRPRAEKALIALPTPPTTGSFAFDTVNTECHDVDSRLVNGTKAQKLAALKDKQASEEKRSLVVARLNDDLDNKEDNIDSLRVALKATQGELAAKDQIIDMKNAEIARQHDEIVRQRDEIAVLRGGKNFRQAA